MKILITCPPMLRGLQTFRGIFESKGIELICPEVVQTLSEDELLKLVPQVEGWIIGDDPATARVFEAGKKGRLKAAVKWGVGVDNVNFKAAEANGIPISNTPAMFGEEVSDLAMAYLLSLARYTHQIDNKIRQGIWYKPQGISLTGRKAALMGFGNIGKATANKMLAFGLDVHVYDPFARVSGDESRKLIFSSLDDATFKADFLVVTCALTPSSHHLINKKLISSLNPGAFVINVSRGPLIDEQSLVAALEGGHIGGAGLDVFENEPLAADNPLRKFDNVILGSHNGSNTKEAVTRASLKAIEILFNYLKVE